MSGPVFNPTVAIYILIFWALPTATTTTQQQQQQRHNRNSNNAATSNDHRTKQQQQRPQQHSLTHSLTPQSCRSIRSSAATKDADTGMSHHEDDRAFARDDDGRNATTNFQLVRTADAEADTADAADVATSDMRRLVWDPFVGPVVYIPDPKNDNSKVGKEFNKQLSAVYIDDQSPMDRTASDSTPTGIPHTFSMRNRARSQYIKSNTSCSKGFAMPAIDSRIRSNSWIVPR